MGVAPYKSGEPVTSSKWHKGIQWLLDEEWWDIEDVSGSALSRGSLELAPQDEKGEDAKLKVAPAPMDVPEASTAPIPVTELAIATAISTSMGKDQGMGDACVLAGTALMEILNLEAPSMAVGCWGATVEELVEEDLAEGHP